MADDIREEAKRRQEALTRCFRRSFCESPDGQSVLYSILNRCGYFSPDPAQIRPDLVALANWIIFECGIIGFTSDGETNVAQYMKAISGVQPVIGYEMVHQEDK
ncbi:MAG: hypothetical protein WCS71_03710 [Sphaerochaetaceae bacterium]|jgi:hypothetical protein